MEWEDLFAMIEDIHAHVRETKREVELDDEPHRLLIGYCDREAGVSWRIRLSSVKRTLVPEPDASRKVLLELMKTVEGRRRLANLPLTPL